MEKKDKSFAEKFIEINNKNLGSSNIDITGIDRVTGIGIRVTNKKDNTSFLIFESKLHPNEKMNGDCIAVVYDGQALFFDKDKIKNENAIDEIDKFQLPNIPEIRNFKLDDNPELKHWFREAIERYKENERNEENERKRKYAGIDNKMYYKQKYGSISSDDFDKEKNNKKALIFRNFFPFGKGKGK